MNILILGGGGREHAFCWKLSKSKFITNIFIAPGNAGTSELGKNLDISVNDFLAIKDEVIKNKIDIVLVGPEDPLVNGIHDFFLSDKIINSVPVIGPTKKAAMLEGSKDFAKKFMERNSIPTAKHATFDKKTVKEGHKFLDTLKSPYVLKADGLAAGKGVTICKSKKQIFKISEEIFRGKFKSSNKLILEKFLEGEEASYFLIIDKKSFKFFGTAQDHKKVREKDKGPNTGGMGAYSPAPVVNKVLEKKIIKKIVKPTLSSLKRSGNPYTGFLYVGLMIKNNEPYLIEFNVRMGDPECQVILPRLKTDLFKIIKYAVKNKLNKLSIKWKKEKSMTIVLCSKGYPSKYKKNKIIKNLNKIKLKKNFSIFHAGTKIENNKILSNGGRVLNITGVGRKFSKLRLDIIKIIKSINWRGGFYRRDIGWRVIKK